MMPDIEENMRKMRSRAASERGERRLSVFYIKYCLPPSRLYLEVAVANPNVVVRLRCFYLGQRIIFADDVCGCVPVVGCGVVEL